MLRVVFLAALLLSAPTLAFAEQSELERQAGEAFNRARRYFDAEDFLTAARSFEEAYRLVPSASVHYNIARSYELAEVPDLAAQHYRAFLDARAGNPQRRRQVQERLNELSAGLGWLRIQTEEEGATVTVDGRQRGETPITLALEHGEHEIQVQLGDDVGSRTVEVGDGETSISLSLGAAPPEDDPPRLREERPGRASTEPPVEDYRPVGEERRSARRLHHGFFWAGLGLSVASGVALAVIGVNLLDKEEEYETSDLPAGDPALEELRNQGLQLETATTALWVTTGVLLAATVLLGIFTDWSTLRRSDEDGESSRFSFGIALGRGASFQLNF